MEMPQKGYQKIIVITFFVIIALAAAYFFFNYFFVWTWPIFVAFAIAACLQPLVRFFKDKCRISTGFSATLLVLILFLVIGVLAAMLIYRVVYELYTFSISLASEININTLKSIEEYVRGILDKIPFIDSNAVFDKVWAGIGDTLLNLVNSVSGWAINNLPGIVGSAVSFLPNFLITFFITIIATVYFTKDYPKIIGFFIAQLPDKTRGGFERVKTQFIQTIVKYIRAYALILTITALELYIGFAIIGVRYALLLAIVISVIDILPVVGTGTVLIPWGVISLITGDIAGGIAILVLYLVITVVRQILEPKIIGRSIGLYPLITLVAMYVGLQVLGIFGMFLFPVTIIILKNLNDQGAIKLWKNPPVVEKDGEKASLREKLTANMRKRLKRSKGAKSGDAGNGEKDEKGDAVCVARVADPSEKSSEKAPRDIKDGKDGK